MTGSRAQWYNGILLLASFFSCRLLWGTYQSIRVYQDVWAGLHHTGLPLASLRAEALGKTALLEGAETGIMRFAHETRVPVWLASTYLGSNVVLNTLNFYWFGKMIETVKKRFRGGSASDRRGSAPHAAVVIVEGTEMDGGEEEEEEEEEDGKAVRDGPEVGEGQKDSVTVGEKGVRVVEVRRTETRRRRG